MSYEEGEEFILNNVDELLILIHDMLKMIEEVLEETIMESEKTE